MMKCKKSVEEGILLRFHSEIYSFLIIGTNYENK